jgi:hypothetical protein
LEVDNDKDTPSLHGADSVADDYTGITYTGITVELSDESSVVRVGSAVLYRGDLQDGPADIVSKDVLTLTLTYYGLPVRIVAHESSGEVAMILPDNLADTGPGFALIIYEVAEKDPFPLKAVARSYVRLEKGELENKTFKELKDLCA